jgi:hypothetical protein
MYTTHLDNVCRILAEQQEYERDRLILPLVSIQHLITKINNTFSEHSSNLSASLIRMHIKALQLDLEDIKRNIPSDLLQQREFTSYY